MAAFQRRLGFISSNRRIKDLAPWEEHSRSSSPYFVLNSELLVIFGTTSFFAFRSKWSSVFVSRNSSHVSSEGVPIRLKMSLSCSSSLLPGKRALPSKSSANIHPADHISIMALYLTEPSRSSGERYHNVTTLLVYFGSGISSDPPCLCKVIMPKRQGNKREQTCRHQRLEMYVEQL